MMMDVAVSVHRLDTPLDDVGCVGGGLRRSRYVTECI